MNLERRNVVLDLKGKEANARRRESRVAAARSKNGRRASDALHGASPVAVGQLHVAHVGRFEESALKEQTICEPQP